MLYQFHTPALPLGAWVERIWLCSDAPPHRRERILPSGTIELVINLRDDEIRIEDPAQAGGCRRLSGAVFSGTYSQPFTIDPHQHASILGVHFKPAGAYPFLGLPAGELTDTHVDLETVWGPQAVELRERLCAAVRSAERFSLVEEALLSRLRRAPERHGAVAVALDLFALSGAEVKVRELARHVGLSQRRLIQVFAAEVGLTPKLYGRIQRFQRARALVSKTLTPHWARVAVDCGYFDQSHLIRDFLAFSGFSPADYLRQRSERVLPNHLPAAG